MASLSLPPPAAIRPSRETRAPAGGLRFLSVHASLAHGHLEDLEPLARAVTRDVLARAARLPGVAEAVLLSTCNRVEIHLAATDPEMASRALADLLRQSAGPHALRALRFLDEEDSLRHLLRVAAGLESLIVGEHEVLHQVRQAHDEARQAGTLGKALGLALQRAVETGKRVRARTGIGRGRVSIGSAAVDHAERVLGDLHGKSLLLLGAGELATLVAKNLAARNLEAVLVTNRTYRHAQRLARSLGGRAVPFSRLADALAQADVVLCATSAPHPVLDAERLRQARGDRPRPLLILDMSLPRNVAPDAAAVPGVRLADLEDLRRVAQENLARRRAEAQHAERIVEEDLQALRRALKELAAEPIVARLHRRVRAIRDRELARGLGQARFDPDQRRLVRAMVNAVVEKTLAQPTLELKRAAAEDRHDLLETAARFFRLEDDDAPE